MSNRSNTTLTATRPVFTKYRDSHSSYRRRLAGTLRCEQDAGATPESRVGDFAPFHPPVGLSTVIFRTS